MGQDYCFFGEARAHAYLAKISAFYVGVGVANIVNGYNLDGTPNPDKVYATGLQAASFVGPAGVGAMERPSVSTIRRRRVRKGRHAATDRGNHLLSEELDGAVIAPDDWQLCQFRDAMTAGSALEPGDGGPHPVLT